MQQISGFHADFQLLIRQLKGFSLFYLQYENFNLEEEFRFLKRTKDNWIAAG